MKIRNIFNFLLVLATTSAFGQEKEIRIGPGPIANRPEPIIIFDGINLPSNMIKEIFNEKNNEILDSVSVLPDSIFDCKGKLKHLGIVKIYTKSEVNSGAKKILKLTDNWLYKHPLSKLMINNNFVDWDEKAYQKLTNLQPADIIYAKVIVVKRSSCNTALKIKIKK